MAVELIAKIKPKNNGSFALMDAADIEVDSKGTRLDDKLTELAETAGSEGRDGEDGFSPIVVITKSSGVTTISITDKQGEHVGKVYDGSNGTNGTNGKDGKDGADGKTPVKGTDYFTAADKAELVNDVIAALPTWEGGSY